MNKDEQRTLALASVLQTATLVDQLASTGTCDSENSNASLKSIITNSTDIEQIFTSPKELATGLKSLKIAFGEKTKGIQNVVFYSLALINLEKKLMKNQKFLSKISGEIEHLKKQEFFEISHANSLARLAELYKTTLGELNPTIMVNGEEMYLSNQRTANHIRALLLAGIRAVSLWKSQGGRTWQLLLNKKKTLKLVNTMDF
ncbi:high frequency lysogenization protein HflD [Bathymodiolus septemdierum thioautotrophic gill symbiont]|uniref:High frequency lysogenization protein HflD homolog n=1 Tax=endosymbiont of Bathymodiolus septemdierum str. Myojin knoll TaxID=1303921 RepID=A0A0P0USF6_9GAMM|nr:high frequency lysogenization protein HflD [Bathymodiolus septemdierum thioautotrophic gill symbiont]BAS68090.1 high frequency lysogenization protein [endosymbiont of Bathymodiolus septemdierum str. Myojin knoll]